MGEPTPPHDATGGPTPDPDGFARSLADRIVGPVDAYQIITEGDAEKAEEALERLGVDDTLEHQLLAELAFPTPLAKPLAFPVVHRTLMRSVEVYQRNGGRRPQNLPAGFLRPLVTPIVTVMVGMIVRSHLKRVVTEVRQLYAMREAASVIGSPEHRMLSVSRRQVDNIAADVTSGGFAVPAFLVGGATLSAVVSVLENLLNQGAGRAVFLAVTLVLTCGAFWCILMAAAVTRRRTRIILDEPLELLWSTVGAAGEPPHEPSRVFVVVASLLLVLGWIVTPVVVAVVARLA